MKAFPILLSLILSSLAYGAQENACTSARLICRNADIVVCLSSEPEQAYVSIPKDHFEETFPLVNSTVGNDTYYTGPGVELTVTAGSNTSRLDLSNPDLVDVTLTCQRTR